MPPLNQESFSSAIRAPHELGLRARASILAFLFAAELLIVSTLFDNADLASAPGLTGMVGDWAAWAVRGIVAFSAIFAAFAYLRRGTELAAISADLKKESIAWPALIAHILAIGLFTKLSLSLYSGTSMNLDRSVFAGIWLATGLTAGILAVVSVLRPRYLIRLLRGTGSLWAYVLVATVAACLLGNASRTLWRPATRLTFFFSESLLRLFADGVVADAAAMRLGTGKFEVEIAPECSGFEGAGLIVAFAVLYLWLLRREVRFPRAFLLIPAGVATIYVLNSVRIAALILIGDAGAPQIATGGFHSQAGWIAFSAVAFGLSLAARRSSWLTTAGAIGSHPGSTPAPALVPKGVAADAANPASPYLLPFLAILLSGMLASSISAGFEWAYPLRLVAAAGVLWTLRRNYSQQDWSFGWMGPVIGCAIFALWIGLDRFSGVHHPSSMPAALSEATPHLKMGWIAVRALAAIVTVPIAEELAFRGFLMRRLCHSDFEQTSLRRVTWMALLISSFLFGLLHGPRWMAGTVAGMAYGCVAIRKGRIGEAVIAHAVTNALLAVYVIAFDQWQYW